MPYFAFDTMDLDQCMILSLFVITKLFEGDLTLPSYDKNEADNMANIIFHVPGQQWTSNIIFNHLGGLLWHQNIVNDCSWVLLKFSNPTFE
jgi:hypothetical protein